MTNCIQTNLVEASNEKLAADLEKDFAALGDTLARQGVNIEDITSKAAELQLALPSWGVGTGGTRFARFPGIGEPRNIFEKTDDCSVVNQLTQITPGISLHIPWDTPQDVDELKEHVESYGMYFDAMNSNTFQDQPGQEATYKFGSLSAANKEARELAIAHNIDVIELGRKLGSKALTVWVGDGTNFPGQANMTRQFENYLDSMKTIYQSLPDDWAMMIEHKMFEPAFYSTVIQDWGSSYLAATELGDKASCLVDLGHHAPNVNIEMIVARLAQFGKLGGFHFNDSKYGDDDLDSGSINPYQLYLIFNELVEVGLKNPEFKPAYMLDQSHNVTDPIESLMMSAIEVQRAFVKALLVDRKALNEFQDSNDVMMGHETIKAAFAYDVRPILAMARYRSGGAINPLQVYRESGYRQACGEARPQQASSSSGIV